MTSEQTIQNLWGRAHVDYSLGELSIFADNSSIIFIKNVLEKHGIDFSLYTQNVEIKNISSKGNLYLAHFTNVIQDIQDVAKIFSSAGCLVGSVYCTQITKTKSHLQLNDLGAYLVNHEIPKSLNAITGNDEKPKECIFFSIKTSQGNSPLGINYLDLGDIHCEIFESLSYLLSRQELNFLENEIIQRAQKIKNIVRVIEYWKKDKSTSSTFFDIYSSSVQAIPLLGYIMFEGISLYLSLCAQDEYSQSTRARGYFPNKIYKLFIFEAKKNLYANFSLASLDFNYKDLSNMIFLMNEKYDTRLNFDHFIAYLVDFCIESIKQYLIPEDYKAIESLRNIQPSQRKFIGHTIHRLLRSMSRNQDFYFYFEQTKALSIWNYWNKENVQIPFTGIFPKGELGINPANPVKNIDVYIADLEYTEDGEVNVFPRNKINCEIVPRLVDLKYTFMRNK